MFLCLKMMKTTIEIFNNNNEYEMYTSTENQLKMFKYSCENYYLKIIIISKQFFELLITQLKQLNSLDSSDFNNTSYTIKDLIRILFQLYQTLFENSNPQILINSNNNNNISDNNNNNNSNEYYMKIYPSWSNIIFDIMSYLVEIYNELIRIKDFDHIESLFKLFIQVYILDYYIYSLHQLKVIYLKTMNIQ